MTTTAVRGSSRVATANRVGSRVPGIVVAALTAAGLGLLFVETLTLLAWASDGRSDVAAGTAARAGLVGWLLGHKVPVELAPGTVAAAPMGLTLLFVLLLVKAGSTVARRVGATSPAAAIRAGTAVAVPYAVLAGLASGVARLGDVTVPGPRAVLTVGLLAAVAGGLGGLHAYGFRAAWRRAHPAVADCIEATAAGLLVLLGGGLVGLVASLAWHAGRAVDLVHAVDAGLLGGVVLVALCLLLLPNAVVWVAAYSLGTGFALGVGTKVAPSGVEIGNVPALPLLAALPGAGPAPRMSLLLVAVPVVAGMVLGWALVRRVGAAPPGRAALLGGASGTAAGAVIGVCAWLSGGAAGPGRLAATGPSPLLTALAAAEWLGFIGAATAAFIVSRRARATAS
jgi:hypothetical protein